MAPVGQSSQPQATQRRTGVPSRPAPAKVSRRPWSHLLLTRRCRRSRRSLRSCADGADIVRQAQDRRPVGRGRTSLSLRDDSYARWSFTPSLEFSLRAPSGKLVASAAITTMDGHHEFGWTCTMEGGTYTAILADPPRPLDTQIASFSIPRNVCYRRYRLTSRGRGIRNGETTFTVHDAWDPDEDDLGNDGSSLKQRYRLCKRSAKAKRKRCRWSRSREIVISNVGRRGHAHLTLTFAGGRVIRRSIRTRGYVDGGIQDAEVPGPRWGHVPTRRGVLLNRAGTRVSPQGLDVRGAYRWLHDDLRAAARLIKDSARLPYQRGQLIAAGFA